MVRESMLSILRELKTRNNWRQGDTVRVIFHAHRPLKRVDVGNIVFACVREVGAEQVLQMAFVTVSHDHPFIIMDRAERGEPVKRDSDVMKGEFAPMRGTIARIGKSTRLLATNSHKLIKRANSPLPAPLLISLHPDSTFKDVDYIAEQALKFTSLSWRSTLPARTPVTIFYSERIAELLGRLKDVPDFSTTALSVKLKWSRWFL
jgi:argonaute-like protein implicated in RNA metabolism and viral defense